MAKKINLSKGIGGRVMGGAAAGAISAAYDKFVTPMLPAAVSGYGNYVKIALGAFLPALAKGNELVKSAGDGLMAVGASQVISGFLGETSTTTTSTEPVSGVGRPLYARMAKKYGKVSSPAHKQMIGATPANKMAGKVIN